jgi:hypothetical protein
MTQSQEGLYSTGGKGSLGPVPDEFGVESDKVMAKDKTLHSWRYASDTPCVSQPREAKAQEETKITLPAPGVEHIDANSATEETIQQSADATLPLAPSGFRNIVENAPLPTQPHSRSENKSNIEGITTDKNPKAPALETRNAINIHKDTMEYSRMHRANDSELESQLSQEERTGSDVVMSNDISTCHGGEEAPVIKHRAPVACRRSVFHVKQIPAEPHQSSLPHPSPFPPTKFQFPRRLLKIWQLAASRPSEVNQAMTVNTAVHGRKLISMSRQ